MESNPGHGKDFVDNLVDGGASEEYIKGWIAGYSHDCGMQEECDELYEELTKYHQSKK